MYYIEIPKIIEATQVFKLSDHKLIVPITTKYENFTPVKNGAFALLQAGFYEIDFVMPGDYIIEENYDEDYPCVVMRKKDFEIRYKEYE